VLRSYDKKLNFNFVTKEQQYQLQLFEKKNLYFRFPTSISYLALHSSLRPLKQTSRLSAKSHSVWLSACGW